MLTASCHCGRVRFTVPAPPPFRNECHCTVCYKYGANWGYYPKTEATISIDGKETPAADPAFSSETPLPGLAYYVRDVEAEKELPPTPGKMARGHLAFARCAHCGCMTHWVGIQPDYAKDPRQRVGINTRLMSEEDLKGVEQKTSAGPLK
ncbi:hypothetical protein SBRCBS47491_001908 [Sporothrix bragantina]|uniref:CENP-V/GFA domain-containing protein n=1 Tax=Sporothrix bragantina TaxID=671064 RepID=A0ABP0B3A1_9PEZI